MAGESSSVPARLALSSKSMSPVSENRALRQELFKCRRELKLAQEKVDYLSSNGVFQSEESKWYANKNTTKDDWIRKFRVLLDLAFEQTEKVFELQCQLENERRRQALAQRYGISYLSMEFESSPDLTGLFDLFEVGKLANTPREKKPTYKTSVFGELDDELQSLDENDEDCNLNLGGGWCNDESPTQTSLYTRSIPVLPTLRSSSGPDYSMITQGTTCTARRTLQHPAAVIGFKH